MEEGTREWMRRVANVAGFEMEVVEGFINIMITSLFVKNRGHGAKKHGTVGFYLVPSGTVGKKSKTVRTCLRSKKSQL